MLRFTQLTKEGDYKVFSTSLDRAFLFNNRNAEDFICAVKNYLEENFLYQDKDLLSMERVNDFCGLISVGYTMFSGCSTRCLVNYEEFQESGSLNFDINFDEDVTFDRPLEFDPEGNIISPIAMVAVSASVTEDSEDWSTVESED